MLAVLLSVSIYFVIYREAYIYTMLVGSRIPYLKGGPVLCTLVDN